MCGRSRAASWWRVQVVPLFETIDDWSRRRGLWRRCSTTGCSRTHAGDVERGASRAGIMLGYSDSNKDGGFLMANYALQRAQESVGRGQ